MSARDELVDWFEHPEDIPRLTAKPRFGGPAQLVDALLAKHAHELAEKIRADVDPSWPHDGECLSCHPCGMVTAANEIDPEVEW